MNKWKRRLASLLAAVMLLPTLPTAFAAELTKETESLETTEETTQTETEKTSEAADITPAENTDTAEEEKNTDASTDTPAEENIDKSTDTTPAEENTGKSTDTTPAEENTDKSTDTTPAEENTDKSTDTMPAENTDTARDPAEENTEEAADTTPEKDAGNPPKKSEKEPERLEERKKLELLEMLDNLGNPELLHPEILNPEILKPEDEIMEPAAQIEQNEISVDLSGRLPEQLKRVSVQELLGEEAYHTVVEKYGENAAAAWTNRNDEYKDGFHIIENGIQGILDLRELYYQYNYWYEDLSIILVVGKDQETLAMDREATRYLSHVKKPSKDLDWLIDLSVAVQAPDGERKLVPADAMQRNRYTQTDYDHNRIDYYYNRLCINAGLFPPNSTSWLSMDFAEGYDSSNAKVSVYNGSYASVEALREAVKQDASLDITSQIWQQKDLGTSGGVQMKPPVSENDTKYFTKLERVTVLLTIDDVEQMIPIEAQLYGSSFYVFASLYTDKGEYIQHVYADRTQDNVTSYSIVMEADSDYHADAVYALRLTVEDELTDETSSDNPDLVKGAYVGRYANIAEAEAAGAENIREALCSGSDDIGYLANYSGEGVLFTIIDRNDTVKYLHFTAFDEEEEDNPPGPGPGPGPGPEEELPPAPRPLSTDTYFNVSGADLDQENKKIRPAYSARYYDDGYYYNGYQTLFLAQQELQDLVDPASKNLTVYPQFSTGNKVTVYAATEKNEIGEQVSGTKQVSGQSPVKVSSGITTVQYSAAAEDEKCLKNYWVSYVMPGTEGPNLFVNGATNAIDEHKAENGNPERIVMLDGSHGFFHDVMVANIGDQPLTNVRATIENPVNVRIDDYWHGGGGTLEAYNDTTVANYPDISYTTEDFYTKIRLLPSVDAEGNPQLGAVSGTLVITAGEEGQEQTVRMELVGYSGNFGFTTDKLRDAVQYVPYDQAIQNSSLAESTAVTVEALTGSGETGLPDEIQLYPNGVLYGIPKIVGEYTFTARATLKLSSASLPDGGRKVIERQYTLNVLENTDENVWGQTDVNAADQSDNYSITIAIPNQDGSETNINLGDKKTATTDGNSWKRTTMTLETEGAFSLFRNLYIDGELVPESEYEKEEGSTKITLRTKTLGNQPRGRHTIAGEFYRTSGNDNTLRRASQNYTITRRGTSSSSGSSSGGSHSSGSGGSSGGGSSGGSSYEAPVEFSIATSKPENGSISVNYASASQGTTVIVIATPAEGYRLDKVIVTDRLDKEIKTTKAGEITYTFVMPNGPATVKAEFAKVEAPHDERTPFTDVKADNWFADAVAYVYEKKLMNGMSDKEFAPQTATSRSMTVTILYRMEGTPAVTGNSFPDVPAGQWYSNAIIWASQKGIVNGYSNGTFGPKDNITREQLATIVMRYVQSRGMDVSVRADLTNFSDRNQISPYAMDALQWANRAGIIEGRSKTVLEPRGIATRAEIAAILMRVDKLIHNQTADSSAQQKS